MSTGGYKITDQGANVFCARDYYYGKQCGLLKIEQLLFNLTISNYE